jgi:hypothetical protein
MLSIIAGIPGAFALIIALQRGSAVAFLNVYLPVLFLLPTYYRWFAPGLPDPSFHHAAIVPIFAVWLMRDTAGYRFSTMDVVVVLFASLVAISEYQAAGYKEAQNLIIDVLAAMVMPYFLAKALIMPKGNAVAAGKRIVLSMFAVSVINVWEAKMGYTPWGRILDPFFPGQAVFVTTFRWGLVRTAGPYGHAILAGLILAAGFRLQRWLHECGHWGTKRKEKRKAQIITLGMFGGAFMALCKGPWLGAAAGYMVMVIGRSRRPGPTLAVIAILALGISIPGFQALKSWAGVGRENAKSDTQETAAYRWELFSEYGEIAFEKSMLGWGRQTWPALDDFPSIDNYFLLLMIQHGVPALLLIWFMFLWMGARLMIRGSRAPPKSDMRILPFALASIYAIFFVTLVTVYLGTQTTQLFFLVCGWGEGLLLYGWRDATDTDAPQVVEDRRPYKFRRVLR